MEIEDLIRLLSEQSDIREDIIYWLDDNGYLDDFKIQGISYDEDDY